MNDHELDILLMCDNSLNSVGGEQESTKIIINGFMKKYALGVIQPGDLRNSCSSVKYYQLTNYTRIKHLIKRPIAFIKYIAKVREIINNSNPKIIHTQAQVSFFIAALLKKYRLISKDICLIHTERGLFTKYNTVFKHIFFFFMKELKTLITTTEFNMNYWKNALEKKGIILNYRIIENTAGQLFETYDESLNKPNEGTLTIGFAGRYCSWKNWPLAEEISLKIDEIINEKVYVKMAVGCLDEDALKDTKKMFESLYGIFGDRFDGRINISIEEMDKFYYDIDVFILTSNHNTESFGRTLVEAMSRKTVVLTTDAGGSVEVVGDLNNVYQTADQFVERILQYTDNFKKNGYGKRKKIFKESEMFIH